MIDACIHLATIDDLHMQFDIVIIISTENKTCTVQSQCTSNSAATVQLDLNFKIACAIAHALHEQQKFVACLRAHENLMTSQLPVESKITRRESKQARNLSALDTWRGLEYSTDAYKYAATYVHTL